MNSKFTKQEQAKFLQDINAIQLQSDSQLEDSFYQRQTKRMQAQIANLKTNKDWTVLQEIKRNVKDQDQMITEYEVERQQLHKITSNQQKNVIEDHIITAIKQKIANNANQSCLTLADQQYNQSVLERPQESIINNQSFIKVKAQQKKQQEEQIIILEKIQAANQQRQHLAMEQQDKLSMKYQNECLSQLFKERFIRPKFPKVSQKDTHIQLSFSRLPPSIVRLAPQKVSEQTVLPRNAPEIALKSLKQVKRKNLKPSSRIQVKVNSKKLSKQIDDFEDIVPDNQNPEIKSTPVDEMFKQYLKKIKPIVIDLEKIANSYHPQFLRYLQEQEKNFNYELERDQKGDRNITHVASTQNADSLCELKLSFEKLTNLQGIQAFKNLEEAQFQFNLLSGIQPLKSCKKLIELNISHNKIKSIDSLSGLNWLRLLNAQHNLLQILEPNCKSLEVLVVSHNRIETIDLSKTLQLRSLQIQHNRLHDLPQLNLLGLQDLNVSHNQLIDLKGTQQLVLLKKLDISQNRITKIDNISFLYLNELNLCYNRLITFGNLFLPCLQQLRLNNNKLTGKGTGIAFLPNLKELNIDDNQLQGFGCVWWLLCFSKGAEIIRYGNNQYFLSLRQKVRQVYESLLYRQFKALKILNDAPTDKGLAQYYHQNYAIYFDNSSFFQEVGPSLTKIEAFIRLLLRQSTFSRMLQSKKDPFYRQQAFIDYQWKSKVAGLKQVLGLTENTEKPLIVDHTLFYRYDSHQVAKRNLYHLLRGMILVKRLHKRRRQKHFQKLKPTIINLLNRLRQTYFRSQKSKCVANFQILLKGLNENQAAIKIQKVWRGYIRRKIYLNLIGKRHSTNSDDQESVDIGFFDNELQKVQFDIDLQGFQDIIIRPEVFEMLHTKQKDVASKKQKDMASKKTKENKSKKEEEKGGPMMNNFLDSQTKLKKDKEVQKEEDQAEKQMKQWKLKNPNIYKILQHKQQKKDKRIRQQKEKLMTAAERYERFKKN